MINIKLQGLNGDVWLETEVQGGIFVFRNYQLRYSSVIERIEPNENSFCLLYMACQKFMNSLLDRKRSINIRLVDNIVPIALLIIKENNQIIVEQEVDMFSVIGYNNTKMVNEYFGDGFGDSIESDSFLYTALAQLNFAFYESLGKKSLLDKYPGSSLRIPEDIIEKMEKNVPKFLLENKTLIAQYIGMLTTLVSNTEIRKEK
jgi:hypothetical protein